MCGRIGCFDGPWPWSCVLDLEVVAKEPGLRSTRRLCWIARCSFSTPTSLCGGGGTPWATGTTSTTTCTACRARTKPSTTLPSIGTWRARDGPWALACSDAGAGASGGGTGAILHLICIVKIHLFFAGKVEPIYWHLHFWDQDPPCKNTLENSLPRNYLGKFPN